MEVNLDRYSGITVVNNTIPESIDNFIKELDTLLQSNRYKRLIWINIPIERSEYIKVLTELDFRFHHCSEKEITLVKKNIIDVEVPIRLNYALGVGAIIRDGDKILVVKDRFSKGFKLPGGHVNDDENIQDAISREVYEETGVKVKFESIVNLGHFKRCYFSGSSL